MKRAAVPSILVAVVLLAVTVIAEAQQPKKVQRIGYLSSSDPATDSNRSEPFRGWSCSKRAKGPILSRRAWLKALPVPAATLPALHSFPES